MTPLISSITPTEGAAASTVAGVAASPRRPALRLVSTRGLSRDDWLEVRTRGVGSSDAAAAVGLNPYQSRLELWMHKTGRGHLLPQIDPRDDSTPLYWGTLLEPIVAAHYTRRTGRRVRRVNAVLQHPQHEWMLANIDREVLGAPAVQILECKTAGIQGARLWEEGVPEYVQLQVMHQLAVTGKQAADVAVLIGGQELRIHRIERDESMIQNLISLEREFWQYVQRDEAPRPDGSESAERALRCMYPRDHGGVIDAREDTEMASTFSELVAVRQRLVEHELLQAQLRQRIEQRMGDASRILFEDGEVSWKRSRDSRTLDTTRLLEVQPELLQTYGVDKPGSRRFLVRSGTGNSSAAT